MKRSLKLLGLTMVVAVAFSGIAAASSFADEFHWGDTGGTIEGTEPFTSNLTSEKAELSATLFGTNVKLTATGAVSTGSLDNFANGGTTGHVTGSQIHFTNVTVEPFTACKVHSPGAAAGTVQTVPLTGLADSTGVQFSPESGTTYVALQFEGTGCPLAGQTLTVTGSAHGNANGDELEFNSGSGSALILGGTEASFTANFTTESTGRPVIQE